MKSPITLAMELQKKGHTVSFWFFSHTPNEVQMNIHSIEEGKGIARIEIKNPNSRKISESLKSFLINNE